MQLIISPVVLTMGRPTHQRMRQLREKLESEIIAVSIHSDSCSFTLTPQGMCLKNTERNHWVPTTIETFPEVWDHCRSIILFLKANFKKQQRSRRTSKAKWLLGLDFSWRQVHSGKRHVQEGLSIPQKWKLSTRQTMYKKRSYLLQERKKGGRGQEII